MSKTKKKEIEYFDCQYNGCVSKYESYDELGAHGQLVHAEVYVKAGRGDYNSKLPYERSSKNKEVHDAYREDNHRLYLQFKYDLEAEYGVEDNPKKDKLFEIAWEQGHSYGFTEVALHYAQLVELIK